jgi:hypothetical protein
VTAVGRVVAVPVRRWLLAPDARRHRLGHVLTHGVLRGTTILLLTGDRKCEECISPVTRFDCVSIRSLLCAVTLVVSAKLVDAVPSDPSVV